MAERQLPPPVVVDESAGRKMMRTPVMDINAYKNFWVSSSKKPTHLLSEEWRFRQRKLPY